MSDSEGSNYSDAESEHSFHGSEVMCKRVYMYLGCVQSILKNSYFIVTLDVP